MSILRIPSVPLYRNPTLRPGLAALVEFLIARNYSAYAIGRVFNHVATAGTLAGSVIEAEDEAAAEACFVNGLPALPFDAEGWDLPDAFIDAESIMEAGARRRIPRDAVIVPPELEGEDDEVLDLADPADQVPPALRTAGVAPPDPADAYEPTAEDLAEYGGRLEGLDCDQAAAMMAPISVGAPDEDDDAMAIPRSCHRMKAEDPAEFRRPMGRFQADVREFYATHPG